MPRSKEAEFGTLSANNVIGNVLKMPYLSIVVLAFNTVAKNAVF
jgi:hypothetical protein